MTATKEAMEAAEKWMVNRCVLSIPELAALLDRHAARVRLDEAKWWDDQLEEAGLGGNCMAAMGQRLAALERECEGKP